MVTATENLIGFLHRDAGKIAPLQSSSASQESSHSIINKGIYNYF